MIKQHREIRFENTCGALVDYDELRKAVRWYSDKPQQAIKHIYLHGRYPAVSIFDKKIHIHRLLMMYWLNSEIPSEYSVHHINENCLDARKENLALILNRAHNRKHNQGKKPAKAAIENLVAINHARKGTRQPYKRKDISPQQVDNLLRAGNSINKTANILGCDWSTAKARAKDIHDNPELLKGGASE